MKRFLFGFAGAVLITFCWGAARGQDAGAEKRLQPDRPARGGIVTLYALDPLTRNLCFRDGREGLAFQNHRWSNRCSDLGFTLTGGGHLVTAIEDNQVGAIVDLGTADELRARYGYEDAEGGGEGFASIRLQGDKLVILKEDNPKEQLQPLKEGPELFSDVRPSATAPIKLGHIYLLRVVDKKNSSLQQIVKLMVVSFTPNESVTLRWGRL